MKKYRILIVILAFVLAMPFSILKASAAEAPIVQNPIDIRDMPIDDIIAYWANYYNYPSNVLQQVMTCESQGEAATKGDDGQSVGIFQIQQETWNRFTKEMGVTLDRDSSFDQAEVAAYAFSHGHGDDWTTYRAIENGGTYTFYYKLEQRMYTVTCKMTA